MHFIAFDTEDNSREILKEGKSGFEKRVTQIAAKSTDGRTFYDDSGNPKGFIRWLLRFPEGTRVYAHNLQYDLGNVFGDSLDAFDVVLIGGRIIKARFAHLIFLDSYNFWPMKLEKVGKAFGIEKLKFDEHSKEYVFRDVEIVISAMSFFSDIATTAGIESLPSTLGSFCVKIWKSNRGQNVFDGSKFCREALFGGRVELFGTGGKGNIFYTDINSLYPYCMTKKFPGELSLKKDLECEFGIARIQIEVPYAPISPLPVRREDGAIFYPWGKLEGVWTFHEIRNALEQGAKLGKIFESYGTDEGESYYSDFVLEFYSKRAQETDEAKKLAWKLLMNNLYGQLGCSGVMTRSISMEKAKDREGTTYGAKKLCDIQTPLRDHVNYAHAAYVTSYGRLELFKYLKLIDPVNLIYCDTDGVIFFSEVGDFPFPISGKLGEMKLEGEAAECYTFAPKSYQFGKDFKAKGVRKDLAEEFVKNGEVEYDQPFKLREACAFFDRGNKKKLSVWRKIKKVFRTKYDKKSLRSGIYYPIKFTCPAK